MLQSERSTAAPLSGQRCVFGVGHAAVRAGNVEDLFHRLAAFTPSLDHLHPLKRCAEGVLKRPDEEAGSRRTLRTCRQFAAHRNALGIGHLNRVVASGQVVGIDAAKKRTTIRGPLVAKVSLRRNAL